MRKALEAQGFSVAEAAVHFSVGRNTISNWIHGRTAPTPTERREWAAATDRGAFPLGMLLFGMAAGAMAYLCVLLVLRLRRINAADLAAKKAAETEFVGPV